MNWVGKDATDTGGDRNAGPAGRSEGRGGKSAHSVFFLFSFSSLLYSPSYLTLLLLRQSALFLCYVP